MNLGVGSTAKPFYFEDFEPIFGEDFDRKYWAVDSKLFKLDRALDEPIEIENKTRIAYFPGNGYTTEEQTFRCTLIKFSKTAYQMIETRNDWFEKHFIMIEIHISKK